MAILKSCLCTRLFNGDNKLGSRQSSSGIIHDTNDRPLNKIKRNISELIKIRPIKNRCLNGQKRYFRTKNRRRDDVSGLAKNSE